MTSGVVLTARSSNLGGFERPEFSDGQGSQGDEGEARPRSDSELSAECAHFRQHTIIR